MVRTYNRISNRQTWSEENMSKAVDFVIEGGKLYTASINFDVPRENLQRKVALFHDEKDEAAIPVKNRKYSQNKIYQFITNIMPISF